MSHFLRITNVGHVCSIHFILSHKGKAENFAKAVAHQNYISVNLTFKQPYYDDAEYNAETSELVFDKYLNFIQNYISVNLTLKQTYYDHTEYNTRTNTKLTFKKP